MRCKTCDYSLWNLKARQCPECGSPFVPSEFEFVINSVRFCCPSCEQEYYGTGEKGHLVPPAFVCVKCQHQVTMDEMVLRPAAGVREEQTRVVRMPWMERQRRGVFKAWIATIGMSLTNPVGLIRSLPDRSPVWPAWMFALLSMLIFTVAGIGVPVLVTAVIIGMNARGGSGFLLAGASGIAGSILGVVIGVALWGWSAHGILRLTGATKHTIGRTFECLLYSIGTNALIAVPCVGPYCGGYVVWIWWLICAAIMIAKSQEVNAWRAIGAALALPVLLMVLTVGGYAAFIAVILQNPATFGPVNAPAMVMQNSETTIVTQRLLNFATGQGRWPVHGLELARERFSSHNFIGSMTSTDAAGISVGATTLDQFDLFLRDQKQEQVRIAAALLPDDVIAHRIGDFVFTYHGVDVASCDPAIWLVVYCPDPDFNAPATSIIAGLADGSTIEITTSVEMVLGPQNNLRAKENLLPLPDPRTVTHANPATGDAAAVAPENDG